MGSLEDLANAASVDAEAEALESSESIEEELGQEEEQDTQEKPATSGDPIEGIAEGLASISKNKEEQPPAAPKAASLKQPPPRAISLEQLAASVYEQPDTSGEIRIMRSTLRFTGGQPINGEYLGHYWDRGFLIYPVPVVTAKDIAIQTGAESLTVAQAVEVTKGFDPPIKAFQFLHSGGKAVIPAIGEIDPKELVAELRSDKQTLGTQKAALEKKVRDLEQKLEIAQSALKRKAAKEVEASSEEEAPEEPVNKTSSKKSAKKTKEEE